MAAFNYFSHDDPGPPTAPTPARTAADRVATCGYRASWGENIAEGFTTAQSVLDAWLNSPGHKANIENPSYVATGVGVATASNGAVYWVQDFGTVADGGTPPGTTTAPATTTAPTTTTTPPASTAPTTTAPATTTQATATTTPTTTTDRGATTTTTAQGAPVALRLAAVHAGVRARRLALTTRVSSSGAAATPVHVKCAARLGRRNLRVVANVYRGAVARCVWRLPRAVQPGVRASGWIRVTLGPLHVRRAFGLTLG